MGRQFDLVESIKKIAFNNVLNPDSDAIIRKIQRWFSKEFSMPLSEVEDLSLPYLLLNYFECQYEELEAKDRDDVLEDLILTPAQRTAKREAEDAEDAEYLKILEEEAKTLSQAKVPKPDIKKKGSELPDLPDLKLEVD